MSPKGHKCQSSTKQQLKVWSISRKTLEKPFLAVTGGQWPWIPPALCLDPLRPPHPIPPSPVLTTKSRARKRPPIFFDGIPNQTSVSGLWASRRGLWSDSKGLCGYDGRGLTGKSDRQNVIILAEIVLTFQFVYFNEIQFSTIFIVVLFEHQNNNWNINKISA